MAALPELFAMVFHRYSGHVLGSSGLWALRAAHENVACSLACRCFCEVITSKHGRIRRFCDWKPSKVELLHGIRKRCEGSQRKICGSNGVSWLDKPRLAFPACVSCLFTASSPGFHQLRATPRKVQSGSGGAHSLHKFSCKGKRYTSSFEVVSLMLAQLLMYM